MRRALRLVALGFVLAGVAPSAPASAEPPGDWRGDAPGVWHEIKADALPRPYASRSANNGPEQAEPPPGALPKVPAGFAVTRFAEGLEEPRTIRIAPNGDIFVAETAAGQIRVLRARPGAGKAEMKTVFAANLEEPFGLAFYPPGPNPEWLYVANTNSILRFPYTSGDTAAHGLPQTLVPMLVESGGGHATRDLRFSADGKRMLVSVGSASNVASDMPRLSKPDLAKWSTSHPLGAAWEDEDQRADVLSFDPDGGGRAVYATGIRNCVGEAVQPRTGDLWCATNERDGLGDNLVPDYVTRVRPGAFYGWPWYYLGNHEDPRQKGARPDLAGKATVPDVLLQSHSAPLGIDFYAAPPGAPAAFPADYAGDAFVTMHGSWNRAPRTGYKVVRVKLKDGVATGSYQDFLTGFVLSDKEVWGRPVGVAAAADGALLVSEDANGAIYRIAPAAEHAAR